LALDIVTICRPLNVLLFGGCLVHWPVRRTSKARGRLRYNAYGPIKELHSFGEMFQIVEILRGQKKIPEEFESITPMTELSPVRRACDFGDIDVALLEPASPIELTFRGIAFNRNAINLRLLRPSAGLNEKGRKLAAIWLRQGLVGLNDTIRGETAAALAEHVTGDTPGDALTRALVLEARSSKSDVLGGFIKMRELLDCPIGVVSYVFRYMPDGRPVSWPAGFREEVFAAAQQLNLPIFDPAPLVQASGVETALMPDQRHYSERFLPMAGAELVEFARSVHRSAKMRTARTGALRVSGRELWRIAGLWLWSVRAHLRLDLLGKLFCAGTGRAEAAGSSGEG
jgi:hypothetical protein